MIVRAWRGRAAASRAAIYPEYFKRDLLPELRRTEGFVDASLLRETRAHDVEFLVLTRWQSMDAIRAFAGANIDRAVVEPEAAAALVDVHHYEVLI
jgi:heme-degrading monooxygenase HmoA